MALDYRLAATLVAPTNADAPLPSVLRVRFGTPSVLHVQILQTLGELTLSEEALNLVLDVVADELIVVLNDSLGEIPIPSIDGFLLEAHAIYMDGPGGDYLTIAGDLLPPP